MVMMGVGSKLRRQRLTPARKHSEVVCIATSVSNCPKGALKLLTPYLIGAVIVAGNSVVGFRGGLLAAHVTKQVADLLAVNFHERHFHRVPDRSFQYSCARV